MNWWGPVISAEIFCSGRFVFFNCSILHSRILRAFGPREPRLATTFGYAMHREPPYPLPLIRSKTVGLFGRFLITLFRVQSAFTGCNDTLLREKVVRAVFLTDNHAKVSLGACAYWQEEVVASRFSGKEPFGRVGVNL